MLYARSPSSLIGTPGSQCRSQADQLVRPHAQRFVAQAQLLAHIRGRG